MLIAAFSFAQNQPHDYVNELNENEVIPPKFCAIDKVIQGETYENIDEFMSKNIVYPVQSTTCSFQGTELVKFTVNPSGQLTNFAVINSVCKKMDEEVINVLKLTNGMWQPGFVNGSPVAMEKEVSVAFVLHPSNDFVEMAKDCMKHGNVLLFEKGNPKKALKYYNMGINLLPNNETLLAARGLCKYEMGDETGADRDWERLKIVAGRNKSASETDILADNFIAMRGYAKMKKTIKK
jgi:tetratricopeptide (TPR) repeat protein